MKQLLFLSFVIILLLNNTNAQTNSRLGKIEVVEEEDFPPPEVIQRVYKIDKLEKLEKEVESKYRQLIDLALNKGIDTTYIGISQRNYREMLGYNADVAINLLGTGGSVAMHARRELAIIEKEARLKILEEMGKMVK